MITHDRCGSDLARRGRRRKDFRLSPMIPDHPAFYDPSLIVRGTGFFLDGLRRVWCVSCQCLREGDPSRQHP